MTQARSYLDHAASAPMLPEAREAWLAASEAVGNPSSLHTSGRLARRLVEEARESVAADLGVRPSEVVFTAGGTEADNLAIKGLAWAGADEGRRRILCSPIEHHAVLDPVEWLDGEGFRVEWLPVDSLGRVDVDALEAALDDDVAVCTVMWANNEVGTVQPVERIAAACAAAGVPYHCDAVQALGQLPMDADLPGVTTLALSGHKVGGPVGVGALIAPRDARITPLLHGGGQERDIRSGTLDAPSIAAFAVAVRRACADQVEVAQRLTLLRDDLIDGVLAAVPGAVLNGDPGRDAPGRLPGNAHLSFPGCEGDALLMLLDAAGVECSTGSACTSGVPEPSHVLLALGVPEPVARGSLRFSLGRTSTPEDVDALLDALPGVVQRASRAGSPRFGSR